MNRQGQSAENLFIQDLKQVVLDNLDNEDFGVEALARESGMSRSNLHRKVKKFKKKSISQFIKEIRLQEALKRLLTDDATVSEISYQVGFHSPTYFNTCFREYYGYPPGEAKLRASQESHDVGETTSKNSRSDKNYSGIRRYTFLAFFILVVLVTSFAIYTTNSGKDGKLENSGAEIKPENESIAVIPFNNLSGNPDLDYVGYAMTDAVIARLTKIRSLEKVIPYTSVKRFRNTTKSIPEIAKELDVNNVLQGNIIIIAGEKMKLTIQLIDADLNSPLWTSEYESKWNMEELIKIQTEVTENIAGKLNVQIPEKDLKEIESIPTYNEEAYKNFLKAEFLMTEFKKSSYEASIPYYEKAIEMDPDFIEAYIGLANMWGLGGLFAGYFPEDVAWSKTKSLMEQARQKDTANLLIPQHINYGYFYYEWDFKKMEDHYNRYLVDPDLRNSLFSYVADYAMKTGRSKEALSIINEMIVKNRSETYQYTKKADILYFLNRKSEAKQFVRIGDSIFGDNTYHLVQSSKIYYYLGEHEIVKENLKKIHQVTDFSSPIILWLDAVYEKESGRDPDNILLELQDRYESKAGGSPAWFLALYHCLNEDYDAAIIWLTRSYENHEVEMTWLREEPILIPLRSHPKYREIYEKMNWPVPIAKNKNLKN